MKRNQIPNIYGENAILPPAMKGTEVELLKPSKVPTIIQRDFEDPIYDQLAELSKKYMASGHEERQKKMKQQEIENLKRLLEDHEEEMIQDRHSRTPTMPSPQTPSRQTELSDPVSFRDTEIDSGPTSRTELSDPEAFRPTNLIMSGRLYDMFQKYSAPPPKTVMLPSPEKVEEESVYKAVLPHQRKNTGDEEEDLLEGLRPQKLSPFLQRHVLEEGEDALDPETLPFFGKSKEKELGSDLVEHLKKVQDDIEEEKKFRSSEEVQSTVPPKRASCPDDILKLCSQYHDLCCKL